MSALRDAYRQLAEHSVAGLTSVSVDELVAALDQFAHGLQADDRMPSPA